MLNGLTLRPWRGAKLGVLERLLSVNAALERERGLCNGVSCGLRLGVTVKGDEGGLGLAIEEEGPL